MSQIVFYKPFNVIYILTNPSTVIYVFGEADTFLFIWALWLLSDFILLILAYIPQSNEVERGYTGFTFSVRPSIRLWTESCPTCIFTGSILFLHIISTKIQKVCPVLSFLKFQNLNLWRISVLQVFEPST